MPDRLCVFISSRMQELAPERAAIKAALAALQLDAFVFEDDALAQSQGIRDTYLDALEASDLYLGVFWRGHGPYTVEEFEHARLLGLDCLIFEKHTAGTVRDPALQSFLDRIGAVEDGLVTPDRFATLEELTSKVQKAVAQWQARHVVARDAPPPLWHGVPARPPSHFVGRETLVAQGVRRLRAGEDVAVEGLPGAGKTTLAMVLVHHPGVLRRFRDGVLWTALGPGADPANALVALADALDPGGALAKELAGLADVGARTQKLRDAIGGRALLIVIDDAWQAEATQALRIGGPRCAHLLTTRDKAVARAFLGDAGALAVPELDDDTAFALLQGLAPEACRSNEPAARALVHAVGGLPQAVRLVGGQLASALAGMFADVFPELGDDAFAALADPAERLRLAGERVGARQSAPLSLQDTVLLSLQGLSPAAEQAFFALGAFAPKPDSFDRAAAEHVTGADARTLAQLAARHLLDTMNGQLALHPTVADVARPRAGDAVGAHLSHYLEAARAAGADWRRVEAMYPQIRWAWQQAPDGDALFMLLAHLNGYQLRRGLVAERLRWAERCLAMARARALGPAQEARLHQVIGQLHRRAGHLDAAAASHRAQRACADQANDDGQRIEARLALGLVLARDGQPDAGLVELAEALTLARAVSDTRREAESLTATAFLLRNRGRLDEALDRIMQALALYRQLGDRPNEADALGLIGTIHQQAAAEDRALDHLGQALALRHALGHAEAAADVQLGIAQVHLQADRVADAERTARQALQLAEDHGDRGTQLDALDLLADVQRAVGRFDAATELYRRSQALAHDAGLDAAEARAWEGLGLACAQQGQREAALQAYAQALGVHVASGDARSQAVLWGVMAGQHLALGQPGDAVHCRLEALACWRRAGADDELPQTLRALTRTPGQLADTAAGAHALDALLAALRPQAGDPLLAPVVAALERRRADVQRFGHAILRRTPGVLPVMLELAEPPPGLSNALDLARAGLRLPLGWTLPPIELHTGPDTPSWLGPDEALLTLHETRRLILRAAGAPTAEAFARGVAAVLRGQLADFVGHDELLRELQARLPATAERLRRAPAELSTLVALLRGLLDELVPLTDLAAIVQCFEAGLTEGRDRLAIMAAVRRLPAVRPLLPGNEDDCRYLQLSPDWARTVAAAIRIEQGIPTLMLDPPLTQRLLQATRTLVEAQPRHHAAVLVDDPSVRRFVRKVVELEFPRLAAIARDELLQPPDGRIVGVLA